MSTAQIPREQRTWTTIEGKTLRLVDMEESHIRNCIKMLEKHKHSHLFQSGIEELQEELLHRSGLGKELL
jgi:hypothetical protein